MIQIPGILPSAVASLICLLLAAMVWKRRRLPVARTFYWVLSCIFIWVFSRLAVIVLESYEAKLLVSKFQYIGIAFLSPAWLAFSLSAVKHTRYLTRTNILLASAIPAVTVLLAMTNEYHYLLWKSISFEGARVIAEHGGWFAVHIAYSYALIAVATLLAAVEYFRHPRYKTELIAILVAPLTVLFANFNNLIGWLGFGGIDTVSIAFSVSSLLFFWVVLKDNYLQLVPVARAALVENMQDPIVVLDDECHVIDANPSAMKLFGAGKGNLIGERFDAIVTDERSFRNLLEQESTELEIGGREFQALNTRISISEGNVTGAVIVMRDITELKITQEKLKETSRDLQKANKELLELANSDGLTGIANRRSFFQQFTRALSLKERAGTELCMLILDLDHFKKINDEHGHTAGDAVLKRVAGVLKETARKHDIVGRLGGEEFGVVFPDTDIAGARVFAERLRANIECSHDGADVPVTASMGLSAVGPGMTAEEAFERADKALYESKEKGRNRITVSGYA